MKNGSVLAASAVWLLAITAVTPAAQAPVPRLSLIHI